VVVSFLAGWPLLITIVFCIQDYQKTISSQTGNALAQIFLDCAGTHGSIALLIVVMGAMFFCSTACLTSASRMLYAMSRDEAVPFSHVFKSVNPRFGVPVNAIWGSVFVAILLGIPSLVNTTLFNAITSLTTVALYISYGLPVFCHVMNPHDFTPGPYSLGKWSRPIGVVATLWVAFISILFLFPKQNPVTAVNMNYAGVMVAVVLIGITLTWILGGGKAFWKHQQQKLDGLTMAEHEQV